MINKLVGAAAIAAIACAFAPAPAQAARVGTRVGTSVGTGCSGDNLANTEGSTEGMPDGPAKFAAQREIAQAQDAMLSNNTPGCAVHLMRAKRAQTGATGSYPPPGSGSFAQMPSPDTMAEAPAQESTGAAGAPPSQPQWNWKPMQQAQ